MTPKWTKTPPTKDGWYWIQDGDNEPGVVHVKRGLVALLNVSSGIPVESFRWTCRWSGPIEVPHEDS